MSSKINAVIPCAAYVVLSSVKNYLINAINYSLIHLSKTVFRLALWLFILNNPEHVISSILLPLIHLPVLLPHRQQLKKQSLVVNFGTQLKVRDTASARPVARPIIVRFWYFLLIILFLRWRQPQVSKMLPAACHHVLEEVSEETPHRHPR